MTLTKPLPRTQGSSPPPAPRLLALPKSLEDLGHKLVCVCVLGLAVPIRLLPFSWLRAIGRFFGGLSYYFPLGRRDIGMRHLDLCFGESKTREEKRRILKRSLQNAGETAATAFWTARITPENAHRYIHWAGPAYLHQYIERNEPFLMLMPHMGNWELLAVASAYIGIPTSFVVHRLSNPYIDAYVAHHRTRSGQGSIYHDEAARQILRTLKDGKSIAMVFDQNMRPARGGIFAEMFGVPAATNRAAAAVALTLDIPVHVVYTLPVKGKDGYNTFSAYPRVELVRTGDKQADIVENTRLFNLEFEKLIRAQPEYWLWTHRRFKNRPEGEEPFY